MSQPLTGKLLVASPLLDDPNFRRTVVFICAHSGDGAFGLVLNRPGQAEVSDHLPRWLDMVSRPSVIFLGGPVEQAAAFGLASLRRESAIEGWMPVEDRVGLVDLSRDEAELAPELTAMRVFTGYAGWGAGQLEGELQAEAWFVVSAEHADLFAEHPAELWRAVLRRQPGKLAMFAYFPDDPSAN
jgi:putative transcriptional regulator